MNIQVRFFQLAVFELSASKNEITRNPSVHIFGQVLISGCGANFDRLLEN